MQCTSVMLYSWHEGHWSASWDHLVAIPVQCLGVPTASAHPQRLCEVSTLLPQLLALLAAAYVQRHTPAP